MVIGLALATLVDPDFLWFAGTLCMSFGLIGVVWGLLRDSMHTRVILKQFDWDTTLFLAGIFVLVHQLETVNVMTDLKNLIVSFTGDSVATNYNFIVWVSVFFSAIIDNVPYITAMIPVTEQIGAALGGVTHLLVFGLLIGACLGGNITHIGAAANIVSAGILKEKGYPINFYQFMKIGLPLTVTQTAVYWAFFRLF